VKRLIVILLMLAMASCRQAGQTPAEDQGRTVASDSLRDPQEVHLSNIRQLSFGGENAEAYFSADGGKLIFQSTRDTLQCDQIFTMNADGSVLAMVSNGLGRTTCSYWAPDGESIIFSSTYQGSVSCPPPPDRAAGYVWAVYDTYDVFRADRDGGNLVRLTSTPGYDAEAVYSHSGSQIVFTSARDNDLEIYTMRPDGSDVRRLTHAPGYDGGPFFSPGDSLICFRAARPTDSAGIADFRALLERGLIRPGALEIYVMRADGSDQRQVTRLGGANFCPYFHPDSRRIVFSSNHHVEGGREFDLFMVNTDGTGLERITFTPEFDGFPMFSPDGTKLVWCSNRHNAKPGETNVFIADWVE
jgi:Tol biopolymer transport system component